MTPYWSGGKDRDRRGEIAALRQEVADLKAALTEAARIAGSLNEFDFLHHDGRWPGWRALRCGLGRIMDLRPEKAP